LKISERRECLRYDSVVPSNSNGPRRSGLLRAFVEIGFIVFLFYSNLLMSEFTRSNSKTFSAALYDIITPANLAIGLTAALIGYLVVEFLRRKF
jgi:hypothetical protein